MEDSEIIHQRTEKKIEKKVLYQADAFRETLEPEKASRSQKES